ncbi:hypothetical protein KBD13_02680, partial [Patescibacteria group bacterium]|nr:hypothetical protein [Patescibacteria group bacterium]
MTRDAWLAYFDAAPEPVQAYLLDEVSTEGETRAQATLRVDHDAWDRVMNAVWAAIFEGVSRQEFQTLLRQALPGRDLQEVERVVLQEVVHPLGEMLSWEIDEALQSLGVDVGSMTGRVRVSLRPMSYGAAVRRVASEAKISLLGEEAVRRLREVFTSYIEQTRTIEQVRELLLRPIADGGLGWSSSQVEAFFEKTDELRRQTRLLSEQAYAQWLQQYEREREVQAIERRQQEKQQARTPSASTKDEPHPAEARGKSAAAQSVIDRVVEAVFAEAGVQGLDEYLEKRWRNVISTRLRGVRSRDQSREVLARDQKVGGLGQSPEEVDRLSTLLERVYTEYHEQVEAEEKGKITQFVQEQQKRIDERQAQEAAERERWFQERKTMADQGEVGAVSALKALMRGVRVVGPVCDIQTGLEIQVEGASTNIFGVDGVQGNVRLMSLAEELETLDIARFRRLAKTPAEAEAKILQKMATLRQESEERWIEGVKRWRKSPLQQAYLSLVARAFAEQRPVA